ncbi:MAG: enoyl-CoA hydratase/isomerase family protein [Ilumatobacteraceae bacterium]|nr:enoyl-CoA hydratase/isomerase family protein [Ilumatobacteraceae bacterium]
MTVHVHRDGAVVIATLDRPERRNAVDAATLRSLLEVQGDMTRLADEHPDRAARVLVITGAAPAFSAGADLTGVELGEFTDDLGRVLRGFGELAVPVIAAIDGPALGAGAQLAVAADLRVATADSVVGIPAARLGLVVDHWTVRRLAQEFTPPVARAMLVAAETYTGAELHRIGAVHRVGNLETALEWARQLAHLAPLTMAGHKLALERFEAEPGPDELVEAARRRAWASTDAAEGRAAFSEKRRPNFTGD